MRIGFSCISVCHSSMSAKRLALISSRKRSGPRSTRRRWASANAREPMPSEQADAMIRSAPGAMISIGVTMPFTV